MKKINLFLIALTMMVASSVYAKSVMVKPAIDTNTPVELVFVVDKSGSMRGFESDTIGGYNGVLNEQSKNTNIKVTTVLFNHQYQVLFNGVHPKDAKLNNKNYVSQGNTAMLDAIGKTINDIKFRTKKNPNRKVVFVIITDGQENSSKEFTYGQIKAMINEQQKNEGWVFMFLGANIDVASEAQKLSIPAKQAGEYKQTTKGNKAMYDAVGSNISRAIEGQELDFSDLQKDTK